MDGLQGFLQPNNSAAMQIHQPTHLLNIAIIWNLRFPSRFQKCLFFDLLAAKKIKWNWVDVGMARLLSQDAGRAAAGNESLWPTSGEPILWVHLIVPWLQACSESQRGNRKRKIICLLTGAGGGRSSNLPLELPRHRENREWVIRRGSAWHQAH